MRDEIQVAIESAIKEERAKWLEAMIQAGVSSHLRDHQLIEAIQMRVSDDGRLETLYEGMTDYIKAVDSEAATQKMIRIWDERKRNAKD